MHLPVDVVIVADYSLIEDLMFTKNVSGSLKPYANWYIKFSNNEVVLAFTNKE